jgi:hypothetical protein
MRDGRAPARPRAAQKTQTYRILRFRPVAALVPSAGTITLQIELRSDAGAASTDRAACPRATRVRTSRQKAKVGAHTRLAILELHTWAPSKGVQTEMEAPLLSFDQLRKNAAECIRLAEEVHPSAYKSFFIEMADRWLALAERAKGRQIDS